MAPEPTSAADREPGTFRVLCFLREFYPTSRVDVEVLFAQHLAARGHHIDFVQQAVSPDIAPGTYVWHHARAFAGATVPGQGGFSRLCRQLLEFAHGLRFLLRAQSRRYDAILVRDKIVFGAIALLIARLKGLRFWFWLSFPFPEADLDLARSGTASFPLISRVRGRISGWLLYRLVLRRCDLAFVQSQRMKQVLSERGINSRSMVPVPMGVDMQRLAQAGRETAPKPATAELGYLGTLDAIRGLDILIDMVALLRRDGQDVRLVLIGDANDARDRERLLQHARQAGVAPYIEVTGTLPREAALLRMSRTRIALSPIPPLPIFDVASPTKLVEYLALGIPVVANTHPDQIEVLRGSRAGVCVPWRAQSFARAVRWLLRLTDAQRDQMGLQGREWVRSHRDYHALADLVELHCRADLRAGHAAG